MRINRAASQDGTQEDGADCHLAERDTSGRSTVVRAGFGTFYDIQNPFIGYVLGSPPGSASALYTNPSYPLTSSQLTPPTMSPNPPFLNYQAIDPHLQTPRTYHWNFTVEQQIARDSSFSAGYISANGRRLLRFVDLANLNPSFTGLKNFGSNYGSSSYNGLQLQLKSRIANRIQVLSSYTWSHSIDTGSSYAYGAVSGYGVPTGGYSASSDRASSDFDSRHTFTFAGHYDIGKHGWNGWSQQLLSGWFSDPIHDRV